MHTLTQPKCTLRAHYTQSECTVRVGRLVVGHALPCRRAHACAGAPCRSVAAFALGHDTKIVSRLNPCSAHARPYRRSCRSTLLLCRRVVLQPCCAILRHNAPPPPPPPPPPLATIQFLYRNSPASQAACPYARAGLIVAFLGRVVGLCRRAS